MKTYLTVLRAILMLTTIGVLAFGTLFSYQNWSGSRNLLLMGLVLFMIMVGDHYMNKRILLKREKVNQKR